MINESPTMSAGTGGFSGSSAATGPVAGFDPVLDFRKKAFSKIKDQPYVSEYRKQKKNKKTVKENVSRLLQYKVTIPEVGETIIYASSPSELRQKMRLLINPRYRGDVDIERVFPGAAAKFYMDKRMKAMRNIPEEANPDDAQMKKQLATKQVQQKIAIEKKKIALKKQEMQKALSTKVASMKRAASGGAGPKSATESFTPSGNLAKISQCAENKCAGAIKFLNGEEFEVTPDVASKVMQGFGSLSQKRNQSKFSNACAESQDSFNRVLSFCSGDN
ncbi:hypothetical protein Syn7803US85_159 [Synechococcus phage ACG-2014d]|uniref:Uncharacterized protein n=1 Tax=Synechococcus phage ACG-2014d TaxID=1493509 RepID=A0A0E3HXZ0_9CAUD|nr:hypothetical protein Syn7803US85_159 [Synechococcus phage ACG-2014d]